MKKVLFALLLTMSIYLFGQPSPYVYTKFSFSLIEKKSGKIIDNTYKISFFTFNDVGSSITFNKKEEKFIFEIGTSQVKPQILYIVNNDNILVFELPSFLNKNKRKPLKIVNLNEPIILNTGYYNFNKQDIIYFIKNNDSCIKNENNQEIFNIDLVKMDIIDEKVNKFYIPKFKQIDLKVNQ